MTIQQHENWMAQIRGDAPEEFEETIKKMRAQNKCKWSALIWGKKEADEYIKYCKEKGLPLNELDMRDEKNRKLYKR